MSSPPYDRLHDVAVVNEGRVDWTAACLTCGWARHGFMTLVGAEDAADEHSMYPPEPKDAA